jgi:type II secretory pathway component PulF
MILLGVLLRVSSMPVSSLVALPFMVVFLLNFSLLFPKHPCILVAGFIVVFLIYRYVVTVNGIGSKTI